MRRISIAVFAVAVAVATLGTPHSAAAAVSNAKVVIVVGATGSTTASYINDANDAAATFAKYTTNIVTVY